MKPDVCTWPWLPQQKYFGDAIQILQWFHSWSQTTARAQRLPSERRACGVWTGVTWTVDSTGGRRRTWADLNCLLAEISLLENAWGTWAQLYGSQKLVWSLDVRSEVCLSSSHPALRLHFITAGNFGSQDAELHPDDGCTCKRIQRSLTKEVSIFHKTARSVQVFLLCLIIWTQLGVFILKIIKYSANLMQKD